VVAPPPEDGDVDPPDDVSVEPLALVSVPVVDVLLDVVVVEEVLAATAGGLDGTLKAGEPVVSAVPVPPPPQAARPTATAIESAATGRDLDLRAPIWLMPTRRTPGRSRPSGAERLHAPATYGAVVEVLLR
jgi:hypothetical protein